MSRISIFGLGYVGAVSAACLANEDHSIIGVDPDQTKVNLINEGKTPIIEDKIAALIEKGVANGRLRATTDPADGVMATEISLICVGTPSRPNGDLELKYVQTVSRQIGETLKNKKHFHVVVCRSTTFPGSLRNMIIPTLEEYSGKQAGVDFGVCHNPEFLREGTSVDDFYQPPKTVIGESDPRSGDLLAALYSKIDAPLFRTDIETAEMVKYVDNIWHALKISFANEIGNICKSLKIDSHKVMDIFCQDTKLNLSPYYLKPGFAFGGSCLPKDIRALVYKGRNLDLELPILTSILRSNELQIKHGLQMVMAQDNKRVSILGFSFKAGTDDLRESSIVELIEQLLGKGYDLRIYDRNVNLAKLIGANREYILKRIPHISKLMVNTLEEALRHGQTIVIGNKAAEFQSIAERLREDQIVVDLVRIVNKTTEEGKYIGICW